MKLKMLGVKNVIEMGMLPTNDVNDYVESISYIGNFSKGNQNGFGMSIKYPDLDAYLNFLPGGTSELADLYLVNSGIELNIGTKQKPCVVRVDRIFRTYKFKEGP